MRFFDAHCDTVMHAYDGDFDFVGGDPRAHLDLPRLEAAGHAAQLFAIFAVRSYFPETDLRALAERAVGTIHEWAAAAPDRLQVVTGREQIRRLGEGGPVSAIIGMEGADPLEAATDIDHWYGLGIRHLIPAWDDNRFSGTSMGSSGPLSAQGVALVDRCGDLGIVVDVSHLSDAAFDQVATLVRGPFIASHSDCRALSPTPRNATDSQIRTIGEHGGALGVNLAADFLEPDYLVAWDAIVAPTRDLCTAEGQKLRRSPTSALRAIPLPGLEWVARHVRHAINLGGEECVGFGFDLDGISFMPEGFLGVEDTPAIVDVLAAAGLTERQIELVCWRNMARVFADVLR